MQPISDRINFVNELISMKDVAHEKVYTNKRMRAKNYVLSFKKFLTFVEINVPIVKLVNPTNPPKNTLAVVVFIENSVGEK